MLEKVEALLVGLVLLNAFQTGQQDIPSDFFVDPETGVNAVIVVGSVAASTDIVSAVMLASVIGNMSAEEFDLTSHVKTMKSFMNINWVEAPEDLRFPTIDVPDAMAYQEWEHGEITSTLEPLYFFDDVNAFWGNNDGHFQPWETHEEIQIRFDRIHIDTGMVNFIPCLYGGTSPDEQEATWYSIPGVIYRADNIFVPPSVMVELPCCYPRPDAVSAFCDCFGKRILSIPEPWLVAHDMLPQFKLFNIVYTVVDGGVVKDMNARTGELNVLSGTPYLVTGSPHFESRIYLQTGEEMQFGLYTIKVADINEDKSKALLEVSKNGELIEDFWLHLDSDYGFTKNAFNEQFPFSDYTTCKDVNRNGNLDPCEITGITNDYDDTWVSAAKWVVDSIKAHEDMWGDYSWEYYLDNRDDPWLLFVVTDIVIDGVTVVTDDKGPGVEIQVYYLEDRKVWHGYNVCDPFHGCNYQIFLDAYQSGWDSLDTNSYYLYQPPGTFLWPQIGLQKWQNENPVTCPYKCGSDLYQRHYKSSPSERSLGTGMFVGNGFLDCNDGHTGYEYNCVMRDFSIYEKNDLDGDSYTSNDCRNAASQLLEDCTNQYDIEDPVIWHGPGVIMVEVNAFMWYRGYGEQEYGSLLRSQNVKSLLVSDYNYFSCRNHGHTTGNQIYADIKETGLIVFDTEVDLYKWKSDSNLILIGGPRVNALVHQLVEEGISKVDWITSSGEREYIDTFEFHLLIVAGKDRESTFTTVQKLISGLY
ncbi:MAG: S-layer protein [Theionarchaea archaeon]|nr:S-layer protein [Theionarchaea archaeon]